MSNWVDVCAAGALAPGEHVVVEAGDVSVVVFNLDGEFYALEDMCSHEDARLSEGMVEDHEIVCPRHGASFCLRTGKALTPPAYESVEIYAVRIEDDMLQISESN